MAFLLSTGEVPSLDIDVSNDAKKAASRRGNDTAYNAMIGSMPTLGLSFTIVDNAETETLPDRNAALVWKKLLREYELNNMKRFYELEKKLEMITRNGYQDLEDYIKEIKKKRIEIKKTSKGKIKINTQG